MADNPTFASDNISGVQYPRGKVTLGPDGTNTGDWAGTAIGSTGVSAWVDPRPSVVKISQTPTVSVAPAYSTKDAVGGLLTFANAARDTSGALSILSAALVDKGQQMKDLELALFAASITAPTDNAIFNPSDTECLDYVGSIYFPAGLYSDFSTNSVCGVSGIGMDVVLNGGTSLYGALIVRDSTGPTYTATNDIVVTLFIQRY